MRLRGFGVDLLHGGGNHGSGHHAPGDGFTVQEVLVTGFGFQRVADGVSEIEDAAQAGFALVGGNHLGLHLHTFGDQPFQRGGIALQDALAVLLHEVEDVGAANDAALQGFVKAGAEFALARGWRARRDR